MATDFPDYESLPPLREVAAKNGMLYGAAVGTPNLRRDEKFRDAVIRECNVLVPEYEGKWKHLMPDRWGAWHYKSLDELVLFADTYDMKVRGHTLIWHEAFPDWAKEGLKEGRGAEFMDEYIQAVVSRYRGRIFSWDVVNEAIEPKDKLEGGLRKSPWLEALGPDYIERAFRRAHEADPTAQLVYNDFDMEIKEDKAQAVLALLRRLKEKDAPIHAVGLQAHLETNKGFKPLKNFCEEVKKMGLEILITELDVWDYFYFYDKDKTDRNTAEKTKEFLDIVFSVAKPKQILTWGLSDKYSWLSDKKWNKKNHLGIHARGLPLDDEMRRKRMWKELVEKI